MSSASDIRAGGAFWELCTKNGPLYAGLQAAQQRIKAVTSLGTHLRRELTPRLP